MTLIIVLGSVLVGLMYLTAGFMFSRKYYAPQAIKWETGYLACKSCQRSYGINDRDWHARIHQWRSYQAVASLMVVFWPLMFPCIWAAMKGTSLKEFYLKPIKDWEQDQKDMKKRIKQMKAEMNKLSSSEREIYQLAIDGLEEKIVRK